MVVAVVLAAGLSRRMGRSKLLLDLGGRPVIRRTVEAVLAGGVDAVLVVTGPERGEIEAALAGLPVRFAPNPRPEDGQGTSISAGIAALPAGAEAVLIALGDQPFLPPQVIPELLAAFSQGGTAIAAPRYRGQQGNPVLFGRDIFPELLALAGDSGARLVVGRDPARVAWVDVDLPMPADVDTPEDYERLRAGGGPV